MSRPTLMRACDAAEIAPVGPTELRQGENAVWRVRPGVIARISRISSAARVARELRIAEWLATCDFPAVRPIAGIEQPVDTGGGLVTFWEDVGPHRAGEPRQVADLMHRLHALPPPTQFDPGSLDPFVRLEDRLQSASHLSDVDRSWLLGRIEELQYGWRTLPVGLDPCLVHGDAWVGNIAFLPSGRTLLMDLERAGIGPPEWDLVSTAIKRSSFGWISDQEYDEFCTIYGTDVTSWTGFTTLRDIRELRMATYALQRAETDPKYHAEASFRIRCLQGREGPRPWPWHPTD